MGVAQAQSVIGTDEFVFWNEEFALRAEERKQRPGASFDDDDDFYS